MLATTVNYLHVGITIYLTLPLGETLAFDLKVMQMINGYYSIGETAHRTGLSVKAIRHYANENLVPPSAVSATGYRLYAASDIWKLVLVRLLWDMEFSLPQIRMILNQSPDIPSVIRWQKELFGLKIAHLTEVRSRLEQIPCDILGDASLAHLHTIL